MDNKQSENDSTSTMMIIEKIINQANDINCFDALSFSVFEEKSELITIAIIEINNCFYIADSNAHQLIKQLWEVVTLFGYEIANNRTFESLGQALHRKIVYKITDVAENILVEKEIIPFLKEKSMYVWEEPERSLLLKRISDIENAI